MSDPFVIAEVDNLQEKDLDTGAGEDRHAVVGLVVPKSGGAALAGTATDPLRTDPTGATTQPVSAASLPLPTGAATEATLATRATEATLASIDGKVATEATLATRATQATAAAIQAALELLRDAAGGLAAGANDIGSVRLRDVLGNGINSILNNGIRRLESRASLTSPDGTLDAAVHAIDGVNHLAAGKVNVVDANNSSTAQLAAAASFTGAATDVSQFAAVAITVHSDKDSAADGMKFEFSMDGTNWDDVYAFELVASSSQTRRFQFPVCARYFRVNYLNGSEVTTQFRVQTILNRTNILTSIHRVEGVVKEDRSAQLVKASIIAQREGAAVQDFYPVQADISGNLKVTTIGTDVPADPSQLVLDFCKNGGSTDLLVDGSVTPVNFDAGPTVASEVWSLREVLLTFAADDFSFNGASFGPNSVLANGIDVEIVIDGTPVSIFTVKQNEDFLRLPGRTPLVNNTGPKDVLGAAIAFQGLVLSQATSDVVRIKVQDDLTSVKLQYLTATVFAVKVI